MKKNLKIERVVAVTLYDDQNDDGKKLLRDMWPGVFEPETPLNIMERITSFDDVLAYHQLSKQKFENSCAYLSDDEIAYRQIKLIASCLNEGELGTDQTWFYPVFNRDSGFGFSSTHYVRWGTNTDVGSRLSYKSSELAMYAGKTFAAIYKPYVLKIS